MRTRLAAGVVVLALGALVLAPKPQPTEATWSDPEVGAATFTALTVPTPPYGGECGVTGSLLNLGASTLTIRWRLPSGYALSDVFINYTGAANPVAASTTFTPAGSELRTVAATGGVYETTISGGLLSVTLGASRTIQVQTHHASGWTSVARSVTGQWVILGLFQATCTMTPAT